jgi:predicted nucleotidyltransferase
MVSPQDSSAIRRLAARYRVDRVVLFGSTVVSDREANDIDLGVEGIPAAAFFRFYGDLMLALSKPVDLVDLSIDTPFTRHAREHGTPVYVRSP